MFYGEYTQLLDNKNRMRLPVKLRELIEGKYYLVDGAENYLMVMSEERFNAMTATFSNVPLSDVKARRYVSSIMSTVMKVEEDAQGRFVLSKHALEHSGIKKNIVVVGACDIIEIWSEEEYKARLQAIDSEVSMSEQFAGLERYGF